LEIEEEGIVGVAVVVVLVVEGVAALEEEGTEAVADHSAEDEGEEDVSFVQQVFDFLTISLMSIDIFSFQIPRRERRWWPWR
jgi:hypothetical protein